MIKPIVIYTDHIMNRTLCYNFAKGSNSLLCHVNNFKDYEKTIATYGVLRGTYEIIKKVNNFYYIDHGYFNQSKRKRQWLGEQYTKLNPEITVGILGLGFLGKSVANYLMKLKYNVIGFKKENKNLKNNMKIYTSKNLQTFFCP